MSLSHAKPLCIGLNCALGPDQMRPFMQRLSNVATCYTHAYPNAGLPNAMGGYDLTPKARGGGGAQGGSGDGCTGRVRGVRGI